ncbi:MAG: hypothetical protein ACLQI7_01790, partial [Streptosporangiaceae bacterium]
RMRRGAGQMQDAGSSGELREGADQVSQGADQVQEGSDRMQQAVDAAAAIAEETGGLGRPAGR